MSLTQSFWIFWFEKFKLKYIKKIKKTTCKRIEVPSDYHWTSILNNKKIIDISKFLQFANYSFIQDLFLIYDLSIRPLRFQVLGNWTLVNRFDLKLRKCFASNRLTSIWNRNNKSLGRFLCCPSHSSSLLEFITSPNLTYSQVDFLFSFFANKNLVYN